MVSQAFSYFSIMALHAEKIFLYISHFVSSFSKPFCFSLHASSFHCLFPRVSLFLSSSSFPFWFSFMLFLSIIHVSSLVSTSKSTYWPSVYGPSLASVSSFCCGNMLKCRLLRCRIFCEICSGRLQGAWWLTWFFTVGGYVEQKRWGKTWQWMCKIEG